MKAQKFKITLLLALNYGILPFQTIHAQSVMDNISDGEKAYVLSKFCTEVKYNYVFYNDLTFDWDSLCTAFLPRLLETKSAYEYINGLKHLATYLGDGHSYVFADRYGEKLEWVRPLPMQTKRVADRVFVTEVLSSELQKKGFVAGCEILKVDGLGVIDYVNTYRKPYVSTSTPQWLEYFPYAEFGLFKDIGTKVTEIVLRDKNGKTFTVETGRQLKWDLNEDKSVFDFKVLNGNIGVLKIKTFMGDNYRQQFDDIYPEILKTDGLIIDIRDNTGGNSSYADYINQHLSASPIKMGKWSSRMYVAAHGSWGYPQEWYMNIPHDLKPLKDKTIYTKPAVLLVNETTFSSAENFCVTFRGMNRGKIIGKPTGGSTGNPIFLELGPNIHAVVCTKNEWDVAGNKFIGVGIIPDIEIGETVDMFLSGKDVVIEEALKEIKR